MKTDRAESCELCGVSFGPSEDGRGYPLYRWKRVRLRGTRRLRAVCTNCRPLEPGGVAFSNICVPIFEGPMIVSTGAGPAKAVLTGRVPDGLDLQEFIMTRPTRWLIR